ncbi:MAG: M1 family metallopeptidase [Flavobacterium sp.]|jgi:aminopeptidase N|uniref:M1 family metallopeptidase n=1 Tax=Flavobacterium sp. TaxID=239 RepID=UPI001B614470|nr:M1 family metallopeptidase [Flavobacterium sp.]MBP6146818.1 M1 family metallopeptidase [Flavobacterium sp.]MBP7183497.1 M1 family metallopeptidase [Flavobacterium sp.]MBP7318668.1 M1 family metallopeptidase [Flavobacterium sp.]MBP8887223.1 M1 family metallopeptidase [Flavobacterium sp.]HRL71119.1 M1 family metallopeptidase [Flavobacterium sp.]
MKYLFFLIFTFTFAQQTKFVDFKTVLGKIQINPTERAVSGDVFYNFEVLKSIDTIKIDAQNMDFSDLTLNGKKVKFVNTKKQLQIIFPFKKGKNTLTFQYLAKPKQTMYFIGSEVNDNLQIWTQGQGKYTSHWFPSFDDVNEKVVFNLNIAYHKDYQVISNGILKSKSELDELSVWHYQMQKPMSSYLLMLAIGKFEKNSQKAKSGISLEMYFEPKDKAKFEPTYRDSKTMFDFLEKEIGVKYPWQIYRQAPVRDFLYAGMENTSATLFSTRYVVDSIGFIDRGYANVNAHELAHQWFGNLVTAESSTHHWLQEGFATYYALLAEKEIYGEDYFYSKLYESAQQLKYASRTDTIPLLNAKASSLTFYQKGAWALFVLHEEIGDKAFKKAVKSYLKKHAFQSVTTVDFFTEIKKVSDYDVHNFSKVWLENTAFNTQQVNSLLLKNKSIQVLFEVEKLKSKPLFDKKDFLEKTLLSKVHFLVKEVVLNQMKNEKWEDKKRLFTLALETKNVQLRQTVAALLNSIPASFRTEYETLLDDKSYQTQEIALYNLWNNFPEQRIAYLEKSKKWMGFNDYNLRTLWLTLALSTPNYAIDKVALANELIPYSSINYEANTRQNALEKLLAFKIINDRVLENLVQATTHHMWQFTKFGRDNIRKLLKNPEMRVSLERILPNLNEAEQFQLNRLLKE